MRPHMEQLIGLLATTIAACAEGQAYLPEALVLETAIDTLTYFLLLAHEWNHLQLFTKQFQAIYQEKLDMPPYLMLMMKYFADLHCALAGIQDKDEYELRQRTLARLFVAMCYWSHDVPERSFYLKKRIYGQLFAGVGNCEIADQTAETLERIFKNAIANMSLTACYRLLERWFQLRTEIIKTHSAKTTVFSALLENFYRLFPAALSDLLPNTSSVGVQGETQAAAFRLFQPILGENVAATEGMHSHRPQQVKDL
jgi:hypothetical protein